MPANRGFSKFWLTLLAVLVSIAVVNSFPEDEDEEGPWDSRIRLTKRGGLDSRIRLMKRFPDSRLRLMHKKDRRIRLMKKAAQPDSLMPVPYFNTDIPERSSAETGDDSEMSPNVNYDSRMNEEIDRIVQLIISRYNAKQNAMIKRGGYIRLV